MKCFEWIPIIGWEGLYEIFIDDKSVVIRSVCRVINKTMSTSVDDFLYPIPSKIITQQVTKKGYLRVCLSYEGISKLVFVHRLVADTFLEKIIDKNFINHKDGNKKNNLPSNIEWCNPSENLNHAYKNNLRTQIKKCRVLTHQQMEEIILNYNSSESYFNIAKRYNVSFSTIQRVLSKRWDTTPK